MTALCGGAASRAKPGFAPSILVGAQTIGSLLTFAKIPWAVVFGYLLQAFTIDLSGLCAGDPPGLPTMSATDMQTIADGPLRGLDYLTAVNKFYDFLKYWAWFQFCECATIATPAPSSPPAAPVGLPDLAPPVGGLPPAAPCWDQTIVLHPATDTNVDITSRIMPNIDGTGRAVYPTPGYYMQIDVTDNRDGSAVGFWNGNVRFETLAGGLHSNVGLSQGATNLITTNSIAVIGGASPPVALKVQSQTWGGGDTDSITLRIRLLGCTPTVGAPPQPCCPPDPVLTGQVAQLLQMVTLIQRQIAPFAYVLGAAHAGLSGHGDIAVSGLIGCKVNITTLPAALGQSWTNPVEIFDAGFITWSTPDGYPSSLRVDHNPYLSLPARCGAYTDIAYDFHPGVVATITELKREP